MRWATRGGVHVDRAACAWLVRRHIDDDPEFVFVDDPDDVPEDATPFDIRGVDLSHHGRDCTFETIQYRGAVAHHIGRLLTTCKRNHEAVEQLSKAHARYTVLGSPPWLAKAERDLALARQNT